MATIPGTLNTGLTDTQVMTAFENALEKYPQTAAEVTAARGSSVNLADRLDGLDTAINNKQDSLNAAQLDAVNSGITLEGVAQIETNKNNISINANYGVKNRAAPATVVSPSPDITVVQDGEGHYEISGDSGGVQRTIRIYSPSTPLECTEEMLVAPANTSENTTYACYWTLNDNDNYTTIPAQGLTIPIGAKINRLYIQVQANKIFDFVVNLMVCPKSLYDADPSHQPYAMSNAELTAAIQALQAQLANQ